MTLRAIVVDDEAVARDRLRRLLAEAGGVDVVGEAKDGVEALERIAALSPDVAFLDIRMPGLDGLALARALGGRVHVVFTTAHDEHAVEAFEAAAVDYLMKPIRRERLEAALGRLRALRERPDPARLERILRDALGSAAEPPRVSARRGEVVEIFDARRIGRFHADAGYTLFSLDGREHVLDETLATLAERLAPHGFLRVHRGELVNLAHVKALHRQDDQATAELLDGQRAAVSRSSLPELKRRLGLA